MSPTWEFYPVKEERAATLVFGLVLVLGDGLASWGRPASPCVALFRLRRGFFHFIITTAVSVRARWKKGQWAAVGKRLSQLSFSVYAGQVVFRGAHKQDDDRELGDRETFFVMSLFSTELSCVFCFLVLFVACMRPLLVRRGAAGVGSRPPLFCLSRPPRPP